MTLSIISRFAAAAGFSRIVPSVLRLRGPSGLLLAAAVACGGAGWARTLPAADRESIALALKSIVAPDLKKHVDTLADDAFEGREAGSRGGRAAGGYLAERFQKAGLAGGGDRGTYFQDFGTGYRNLLGLLEGSDPELKREVIVVGAHYDHVGYGSRKTSLGPIGYVHNGADDNASGTASLLEMVDAFQVLGAPPRRSILFCLWDGEEQGLLGSKHWTAQPTLPLDRVVFCLNADMLGRLRNNRVELLGSRTSRGLRQRAARANADYGVEIDFNWELKANSDHHSFFARQIPVLMLHTGLHEDYHRPSDDAEKVNHDGLQKLSRFWFQLTLDLADSAERLPGFRPQSLNESPASRKQFEAALTPPPARLGVSYRKPAEGPGVDVTAVDAAGPGGRAGLRIGDRLLKVGDAPIEDEAGFRLLVLASRSPQTFEVRRPGTEAPQQVKVELAGKPSRIGLWWREDDAEPGSLLINLVVPGSAAAQAGLRPGDRVLTIGGDLVESGEKFRERLAREPAPISLGIERDGRLTEVSLSPLPPLAE